MNRLKRLAQAAGSSGWLTGQTQTGSAQAAGSSGWLTGQTQTGSAQAAGSSGWLTGQTTRGRRKRAGEAQAGDGGPKRLTPLRLAFEVIGVFFTGHYPTIQSYEKFPIYANFSGLFFGFFFGFFGVGRQSRQGCLRAAKPPEGRQSLQGAAKPPVATRGIFCSSIAHAFF